MRRGAVLACCVGAMWMIASAATAAPDGAEGRGLKLLRMQGCTACHSLDGTPSAGPSLAGRMHRTTRVLRDGQMVDHAFDAAYIARSLATPDAEIALGFPAGVMPAYALTDEQLGAVVSTLASLSGPEPHARQGMWSTLLAVSILLAGLVWWRRIRRRGRAAD